MFNLSNFNTSVNRLEICCLILLFLVLLRGRVARCLSSCSASGLGAIGDRFSNGGAGLAGLDPQVNRNSHENNNAKNYDIALPLGRTEVAQVASDGVVFVGRE